jgi:hypothetical protein
MGSSTGAKDSSASERIRENIESFAGTEDRKKSTTQDRIKRSSCVAGLQHVKG